MSDVPSMCGGRPDSLVARPAHRTKVRVMEVLLLVALVLIAACTMLVHRHQQSVAWDRELDQAFGVSASREMPRHRTL